MADLAENGTSGPRTGRRLTFADVVRTPARLEWIVRGHDVGRFLARIPGFAVPFGGQSSLRQLLDGAAGIAIVGGFALVVGGANGDHRWVQVMVEGGGALVLFGALTLAIRPLGRFARSAIWGLAGAIGMICTVLAVYKELGEPWETLCFELGIGAVLFLVLERLLGAAVSALDRWEAAGKDELVVSLALRAPSIALLERSRDTRSDVDGTT